MSKKHNSTERAYTKNSADKRQVKEASVREALWERRQKEDVMDILTVFAGRRLIWGVLTMCGIDNLSYVSRDASETAFREGQRNVGLQLKALIMEADFELFRQMENEAIGGKYE